MYSAFDDIQQEIRPIGDADGTILKTDKTEDASVLDEDELEIIDTVCEKFKSVSAKELSLISHEEKAWTKHEGNHERIPFEEAFYLKAF